MFPVGNEPLEVTWLNQIADHLAREPVIVTQMFPAAFEGSPYFFEPLDAGWLVREQPRREATGRYAAVGQYFDNGMTLVGIAPHELADIGAGEVARVRLAWQVDEAHSLRP